MSTADELVAAVDRDIAALSDKRFVLVSEAALIACCHPETVRDALRSGELHGSQRTKGGPWKLRPACVESWAAQELCEHQKEQRRPVSLHAWKSERSA